jgi:DNA recombination protein RmuC
MTIAADVLMTGLACLATGLLIGWWFRQSRARHDLALAQAEASAEIDRADARAAGLARELSERDFDLLTARAALESQASELRTGGQQRVHLETLIGEERKRHDDRLATYQHAEQQLREAFDAMAAQALQRNNDSFLALAATRFQELKSEATTDLDGRRRSIDDVLSPMRDHLAKVESTLADVEKARGEAYAGVKQQLERLDRETGSLVRALRAPHVRGRWGEVQLRRVVELAGMLEHCDFDLQATVQGDQGSLRPDLVVNLPGGRHVVVDAKAPLMAYLEAVEAIDDETREARLKDHAGQVRSHLVKLGGKNYWEQFEATPEFVVMFLPGEAFFSAALQHDPLLIEVGGERRVILASPLTLLALLKTVAHGWTQEKLADHAREISMLGKELYERLCTMTEHLNEVRKKLDGAVQAFNAAIGSLENRVFVPARKFRDLGVSSTKELEALEPIAHAARRLQSADFAGLGTPEPVEAELVDDANGPTSDGR